MNHEHADAEIYKSRVRVLETEAATATATGRAQLDIIEALEHRIVVLESQMENVRARLDGHDLGFVTMTLDEQGRADLARTIGLGQKERTMDPDEKGTSES